MKSYTQWLQSLIEHLNTSTLVEEPWSVEFVDHNGVFQCIGNSRVEMKKKNGIWVFAPDREQGEFPQIRAHLERAQTILKVNRITRRKGKETLPSHYEKVFRVDTFVDEEGELTVLLDREDNIIETMSRREGFDFVERFEIPVSVLEYDGCFETTQYVMLEDGLVTTISERKRTRA